MIRYTPISILAPALMLLTGIVAFGPLGWAQAPSCSPQTAVGQNCTCDLNALRPLQGAVGMGEVREKAAKIAKKPDKEKKDLEGDPIKVVHGPDNQLFITDHHHGARAWLISGATSGACRIEDGPASTDAKTFWTQIDALHKVHLEDQNGKSITWNALPKTLSALPDDPYRTLAWMVRKQNGFCRGLMDQKEFAEFIWADWLRKQSDLPAATVASAPQDALPKAMKLVESPAAAKLPGYRGDKPSNFTCPKEDD